MSDEDAPSARLEPIRIICSCEKRFPAQLGKQSNPSAVAGFLDHIGATTNNSTSGHKAIRVLFQCLFCPAIVDISRLRQHHQGECLEEHGFADIIRRYHEASRPGRRSKMPPSFIASNQKFVVGVVAEQLSLAGVPVESERVSGFELLLDCRRCGGGGKVPLSDALVHKNDWHASLTLREVFIIETTAAAPAMPTVASSGVDSAVSIVEPAEIIVVASRGPEASVDRTPKSSQAGNDKQMVSTNKRPFSDSPSQTGDKRNKLNVTPKDANKVIRVTSSNGDSVQYRVTPRISIGKVLRNYASQNARDGYGLFFTLNGQPLDQSSRERAFELCEDDQEIDAYQFYDGPCLACKAAFPDEDLSDGLG